MKAHKSVRGFTLLELLSVLVMMLILAALIAPTLLGTLDKERDLTLSEKVAYQMMLMLREEQKINYPARDTPCFDQPAEIEPVESDEDVERSILLNPKFKPESPPHSRSFDLNLWVLNPNNIPIKLP